MHPVLFLEADMKRSLIVFLFALITTFASARGVYQQPIAFINEVFADRPPEATRIWLTGERKSVASAILGHRPTSLRLRYWGKDNRTAWVLEEIGKEKPITVGIVVNNNRIERVKVLIFLESRGWEVRHDFFTNQFKNTGLQKDQTLNKDIDGISGATLSVRALKKLTRLALYLHSQTPFAHDAP